MSRVNTRWVVAVLAASLLVGCGKKEEEAAAEKPAVSKFVEFYLDTKNAIELVKEVGYVPLPEKAIATFKQRFANREIGTGFTGSKIGVSVDDLLKEQLVY